jgi:hypothetical protein
MRRAVFDNAPAEDPITEALADVLSQMALGMVKG